MELCVEDRTPQAVKKVGLGTVILLSLNIPVFCGIL